MPDGRSRDELNVLIKSCAVTFASNFCQQERLASEFSRNASSSLRHDETVCVKSEQEKARITPDASMLTADNRLSVLE